MDPVMQSGRVIKQIVHINSRVLQQLKCHGAITNFGKSRVILENRGGF